VLARRYANSRGNAACDRLRAGSSAVEQAERGGSKLCVGWNAGAGVYSSINCSFPGSHSWATERAVQKCRALQNGVAIRDVSEERAHGSPFNTASASAASPIPRYLPIYPFPAPFGES